MFRSNSGSHNGSRRNAEYITDTIRPRDPGVYEMSPYPFAAHFAEFAFAAAS